MGGGAETGVSYASGEAAGCIFVAPEHAEPMSGLRGFKRPTEGKQEATEVITDLLSSPIGGERALE